MRFRSFIIGSTITVLGLTALTPSQAAAQGGRAVSVVTLQVPSIVKLVVDEQAGTAGGPVVRVVTNDPSIRALAAGGVRAELLRMEGVVGATDRHAKGGDATGGATAAPRVLRYTVVAP